MCTNKEWNVRWVLKIFAKQNNIYVKSIYKSNLLKKIQGVPKKTLFNEIGTQAAP